jgi:hypothetical protein
MAEQVISPGVFLNENVPVTTEAPIIPAGAAIIGPTVLGPVDIPTIVTTYSEYKQKFGSTFISGGSSYSYFTSIAAQKFFQNGGQRLLVTRVASGSFTQASSTTIENNVVSLAALPATASFTIFATSFESSNEEAQFTYDTDLYRFISVGSGDITPLDDVDGKIYYFDGSATPATAATNLVGAVTRAISGSTASGSNLLTGAQSVGAVVAFTSSLSGWSGKTIQTGSSDDFSSAATFSTATGAVGNNAFTLKTFSEGISMNSVSSETTAGVLPSGSRDNVRWEISNSNTSSGDFTLTIRRGDDRTADKVALETFRGVNLDPRSPNYIAKRVGSQYKSLEGSGTDNAYIAINGEYPNVSKYVYVSSVDATTLDYLDDAGNIRVSAASSSIPTNQSGSFEGAQGSLFLNDARYYETITAAGNTQGLNGASSYDDAITVLKDKDAYPFNTIAVPGLMYDLHSTELDTLITNLTSRADAILPIDLTKYGADISTVTAKSALLNTSYAAAYWPWVKVFDSDLNKSVWVPASTIIPAVYAANDRDAEAWFAPAGFNRGGLPGVVATERGLKRSLRDTLYDAKVNPIATFPNAGIVVYGQKTLQTKASATDRVNVRRLLIALKDYIGQVSQTLIFEPNTLATRNSFLAQVNPYLASVQQRQGLYGFKVVMDASNNGPNVIDRNELRGTIYLQPTKTAEFIVLDFNVLPTGAEFPA